MEVTKWQAAKFVLGFSKPYRQPFIGGVLLAHSGSALFPICASLMIGGVTAELTKGNALGVAFISIGIFLVTILVSAIGGLGRLIWQSASAKVTRDFKAAIFSSFVTKSVESTEHSGLGINAINADADAAARLYTFFLSRFSWLFMSGVPNTIAIFLIDWRIGLITLGISLFCIGAMSLFIKPSARVNKLRKSVHAESRKSLGDILTGAAAIRAFGAQQKAYSEYDNLIYKVFRLYLKESNYGGLSTIFAYSMVFLTTLGIFAVGAAFVADGSLGFPLLMMILPLATASVNALENLGWHLTYVQDPLIACQRVYTSMDGKIPEKLSNENVDWDGRYHLEIDIPEFSYKGAEGEVLEDIKLKIEENEFVTFIGESGCGKSTLLRAVLGFYDRDNIGLTIGNLSYSHKNILQWRGLFAYVDQSCKLFDMTIGENIALGKKGASSEEVREAAKAAHADGFISKLEMGYDSPVGEKGQSLSGGEKQRIAIARALVRKSPILIFDEAGSALDAETEKRIMEEMKALSENHTVLTVTHNVMSVQAADRIVVLDGGRIVGNGSHAELIQSCEKYRELLAKGLMSVLNSR